MPGEQQQHTTTTTKKNNNYYYYYNKYHNNNNNNNNKNGYNTCQDIHAHYKQQWAVKERDRARNLKVQKALKRNKQDPRGETGAKANALAQTGTEPVFKTFETEPVQVDSPLSPADEPTDYDAWFMAQVENYLAHKRTRDSRFFFTFVSVSCFCFVVVDIILLLLHVFLFVVFVIIVVVIVDCLFVDC